MTASAGRTPPSDLLAERSVVGSGFLSADAVASASEVLKPDHFYSPAHKAIFSAQMELYRDNQPIDLITVGNRLKGQGLLEQVGGPVYLAELTESVASPSVVKRHAEIVLETARRRALIHLGISLMDTGFDLTADVREFAAKGQDLIDRILEDRVNVSAQLPSQLARSHYDYLTLLSNRGGEGIRTGWYKYDAMTGGLIPGEVVILAARTSRGKTAMALNILTAAVDQKKKVGVLSLEMMSNALISRLYASRTDVPGGKFREADFTPEEWNQVADQAQWLSEQDEYLRIYDSPLLTPSTFRAQARKWKREMGGLDLLIVDYLQLMSPDSKGGIREREVSEASRVMKLVALEFNCTVLCLSQLNREVEKRKGSKPLLSDLRESGSIEQDADVILFIEVWDISTKSSVVPVEIDMAKGRNNQVGSFTLHFMRKHLRFVNPATEERQ